MRKILGNQILTIILCLFIGLIVFLITSILSLPVKIDTLKTSWVINNTVLQWIQYFIPIYCAGVIVFFSFQFSQPDNEIKYFKDIINPILILFIVIAALVIFLHEIVYPGLSLKTGIIEQKDMIALELRSSIPKEIEEGHFSEAEKQLHRYLAIDPNEPDMLENLTYVEKMVNQISSEMMKPEDNSQPFTHSQDEAKALYDRAYAYYLKQDFFSALYFSGQALLLNKELQPAMELKNKIETILSSQYEKTADITVKDLYQKKRIALQLLDEKKYLEAYISFQEILKEYPEDSDSRYFLMDTRKKLTSTESDVDNSFWFFDSELDKRDFYTGTGNIFFDTAVSIENQTMNIIVFFTNYYLINSIPYIEGLEVMGYTENTIQFHIKAPWGKIQRIKKLDTSSIESVLLFNSLSEQGEMIQVNQIEIIEGSEENIPPAIPVMINHSIIPLLSADISLENIPINQLFTATELLPSLKRDNQQYDFEILRRLLKAFNVLLFPFLAVLIGWIFPKMNKKKNIIFVLGTIFIPLVLIYIFQYISEVQLVLVKTLYYFIALYPTIIALCILEGVLLFIVLVLLAGQQIPETD